MACIEFKSHVGPSFGNNFNNRTEEALGSGFDLGAAYREGAFRPSSKPWIGYLMLLEEASGSQTAVSEREPHFAVFPEFRRASYAARYQILMTKLVRESLYSSVCFLTSNRTKGLKGNYRETDDELTFERFFGSLLGHLTGHLIARGIAMTPTPKKRGKAAE